MVKAKPRIFLDTNVIFSGLYSPSGAPGKILEGFVKGKINVLISHQVLEELVRVMTIKLPEGLPALKVLLTNVPPEIIPDPPIEESGQWKGYLLAGMPQF